MCCCKSIASLVLYVVTTNVIGILVDEKIVDYVTQSLLLVPLITNDFWNANRTGVLECQLERLMNVLHALKMD
jgi:hypothetical protein